MKKIAAVLLIALAAVTTVFAADIPEKMTTPSDIVLKEPFYPMSPKVMGMGGAGLAVPGRTDAFFLNPAGLAKRPGTKFQLSLPYAEVTLYNIADMVRPGADGKAFLNKVLDLAMGNTSADDPSQMVDLGMDLLGMLKTGKNKIAKVDMGLSFMGGGFGMATNVRANIHDWGKGSGGVDSELFAEIEATETIAYAHRIPTGGSFSIDLGAAVRLNYVAYTGMIGAKSVMNELTAENGDIMNLLSTVPVMAGWQVAGDVGLNFNLPLGFSIGVVGRNFGTEYNLITFEGGVNQYLKEYPNSFLATDIKVKSPWSLDFGFGWKWDNTFFKPRLSLDFVDAIGLFTRDIDKLGDFRTWASHARVGVDLRLLAFLDLRAGLNQGYWSLGCGVDIGMINVEAAYYITEGGKTLGDKPIDALTVRVNVGFDR